MSTRLNFHDFNPTIKFEYPQNGLMLELAIDKTTSMNIFCANIEVWWQLRNTFEKHEDYSYGLKSDHWTNVRDKTQANELAHKFYLANKRGFAA